jgi:hypothetical protein
MEKRTPPPYDAATPQQLGDQVHKAKELKEENHTLTIQCDEAMERRSEHHHSQVGQSG